MLTRAAMVPWIRSVMEVAARDATEEIGGRSCLVLAPHPDDEVIGCGGTIARKIGRGAEVTVIFLTDGQNGVLASRGQTAAAVRQREALNAAAVLGVPRDRVIFCGFEDGRLAEHVERATSDVRRVASDLEIKEVFVPYRREDHPDHVAAWQIGAASLRPGMRLYEYPIWYGPWLLHRRGRRACAAAAWHLKEVRRAVKVSVADLMETKRHAMAAHASQIEAFAQWDPKWLEGFFGAYELFFVERRSPG